MVKELRPENFTADRLAVIFEKIHAEVNYPGPANIKYFFERWRHLMSLGIGRTWEAPGAVLGALFTPDIFTGEPQGLVVFWFALKEVRGTGVARELFEAFEATAKQSGCRMVCSAAHESIKPEARQKFYLANGFAKVETVYRKVLQ